MRKEDVDLPNGLVWIPDSKTASGVAEVPLTDVAVAAFRKQIPLLGAGTNLFPNPDNPTGYEASFKKVWATTHRKAGVPDSAERGRRFRRVFPAQPRTLAEKG